MTDIAEKISSKNETNVLHRTRFSVNWGAPRNEREREASEGVCADSTVHPLVIYVNVCIFEADLLKNWKEIKITVLHRTKCKPMHSERERFSDVLCYTELNLKTNAFLNGSVSQTRVCADSTVHPLVIYMSIFQIFFLSRPKTETTYSIKHMFLRLMCSTERNERGRERGFSAQIVQCTLFCLCQKNKCI